MPPLAARSPVYSRFPSQRSNRFERGKYSTAGELTKDKERWRATASAVARMSPTISRYRPVTFRWQPAGPFCVLLNGGHGETGPVCAAADHAIPGRAGPAGAGGASPVDDLPGLSGGQHLEHRHLDPPGPCPERPVAVLDVGGDHQLASGFRWAALRVSVQRSLEYAPDRLGELSVRR